MKPMVVLPVMEPEHKKRHIKTLSDSTIRSLVAKQPIEKTDDGQDQEPGMSVDDFMTELYLIVPKNKGVVTAEQAAHICNLMIRYRRLRHKTVYKPVTIRLKKRSGALIALSPEEQEEALGARFNRENLFLLSDILLVNLTRWPSSRRKQAPKPKGPVGRPRAQHPKRKNKDTLEAGQGYVAEVSTEELDETLVKQKLEEIKALMEGEEEDSSSES